MCRVTASSRRTLVSQVSLCDHRVITLHSYADLMTRSSAWQALRRRTRTTRPANTLSASVLRGPRTATTTAAEHVRPVWPSDSKLEEWTTLEFRQPKPPSDEDWSR